MCHELMGSVFERRRCHKSFCTALGWPGAGSTSAALAGLGSPSLFLILAAGACFLACRKIKSVFDTPSRTYDGQNVGKEYDAWTREGILEHYWGEHIHLGLYTAEERSRGYWKKDFVQAKADFVEGMLAFSGISDRPPTAVLDVGCGIGGTTRMLASRFPGAHVTGVTLSSAQVERANELARQRQDIDCSFHVMDAMDLRFPNSSFDFVWACECGEHMPDKARLIDEMTRVLRPGGTLVLASWCLREESEAAPLSNDERRRVQFLCDEWAHPAFVSKEYYGRCLQATGCMEDIVMEDWRHDVICSWRHAIVVGVQRPWAMLRQPRLWYKCVREAVTLNRFHHAFDQGLMEYGMIRARKRTGEGI